MLRITSLPILLAALAIVASSCDDDETPSATPTAEPSRVATVPVATPSPAAPAAIAIGEPAEDSTVTVPFVVSGDANVFEAALTVDVLSSGAGLELCSRPVMATSGTGTPGTWETLVSFRPPAQSSPVRLRAYSLSPRDGSIENVVERTVVVSSEQPSIVIETPVCNTEVASGSALVVSGNAQVFEAALTVELRDYFSGNVVLTQNATAADGTQRSPWTTTLSIAAAIPPGLYELVALSFSAEDGAPENRFAIPISVVP